MINHYPNHDHDYDKQLKVKRSIDQLNIEQLINLLVYYKISIGLEQGHYYSILLLVWPGHLLFFFVIISRDDLSPILTHQ